MPKQIIIAEQHRIAAVYSEEQIQELVVATGSHQVSDIYLGIVENVLPGIDAAFVNIGDPERNGFIHVTDLGPLRLKRSAGAITELLAPQQKVLVQVMKEPTGSKGPRLTGNITLPGRYLVLMPYGKGVNLSRRIKSESERNRLRALAILVKPPGMGLLVRTEAEGMTEEAIIEDLEVLQKQWDYIQQEASSIRPPVLLNRDNDFIQRVLRDMYSNDVNRIVVDSQNGLKRVKQHLMSWNGGKLPPVLVDHHRERISILEYFRVNAAIREALRPRVDLPSGGYIIIEPTEALTVVDVNSGSFTRLATARETVLWTNCEAATEIARQLRLRNVAGVIIVDFIDMDSRRDQLQVLEHFNKALKSDKARPQIAQLSELGLVELTRKRQGQNIYELFGEVCPSCGGLGHLVHLPGEEESTTVSREFGLSSSRAVPGVSENFTDKIPVSRTFTPPPPPMREERTMVDSWRSGWESSHDNLELEVGGSPLDLIHGSPYQIPGNDSARRRRRRRLGDELPLGREEETRRPSLRLSSSQLTGGDEIVSDFSTPSLRVNETYGVGKRESEYERPRLNKSESLKHSTEPPEVVSVEMTPEEQDVYALMGISPLVLLDHGVKNPKNTIISVTSPGEDQSGVLLSGRKSFDFAFEEEEEEPEKLNYLGLPLFDSTVPEKELIEESEIEGGGFTSLVLGESSIVVDDLEVTSGESTEKSEGSEGEDLSHPSRRRRRRSSANLED